MRVAVMAAPRRSPNLHSTIASMLLGARDADLDVVVCLDADEAHPFAQECRDLYEHHCGVRLEVGASPGRTPEQRATHTAMRCFEALGDDGGVVVEDDVTFARRWAVRLDELSDEAPDAVLFGYERHAGPWAANGLWAHKDLDHSTVLTSWPAQHMAGIRAAFRVDTGPHGLCTPAEWVITRWCHAHGVPMLSAIPSLVQHLGDDALINPHHGVRRSPMWRG